ncbi:MAG: MFS transporter [Firmicutes bacterium]|nr:MFS transporter [Bacillota bacterium]MDD4693384.1 MFS transporter [Bacillota bacterium]
MQEVQTETTIIKNLRHNYKVAVLEGATYSLMFGLTGSFLGVLALKMGASPFQLSLMTALPNLVNVLFMVPVASYLENRNNKMPYLIGGVFFNRIGYLFLGLAAFLGFSPNVFLLVLAMMTFPSVIAGLSYTDVVASCFPPRERGRVFGAKNAVVGLLTFVCTMIAGFFLDLIAYPYNYLIVFGIASFFGVLNTYTMSRLRVPENVKAVRKEDKESYITKLKNIFAHPTLGNEFKKFLVTIVLVHIGFNVPSALWTIFYVEQMNMTQFQIGNLTAISNAIIVMSSFFWGTRVQKSGDKAVYGVSIIGIAMVAVWATLARSVFSLYLLQVLNGFSMAAYNLAYFNILISSSDEKYRPTATATFHALIGITGVIFPTIGVWLYSFMTIRQIFLLSALIRFLALFVALKGITKGDIKGLFNMPKRFFIQR